MEYRENRRTGETGFYRITHYKTIAPYTYIESYTEDENGESDAQYLRSYDPFVQDIGSADIIAELEVALDLSDRERAFLAEFRKACRFYDFTEAKAHAWRAVGVTNGATQRKAFERLKARIVNAISVNEALSAQYSYLMK